MLFNQFGKTVQCNESFSITGFRAKVRMNSKNEWHQAPWEVLVVLVAAINNIFLEVMKYLKNKYQFLSIFF